MLKNMYRHFKTINHHRFLVMKMSFKAGMYYQGLTHDLSKYSFTEFYNSAKYYLGYRSPVGNERKHKGYSEIFLHHKGHNKHHFEYWYDPYALNSHISMPDKYILESVIDRIAACKTYQKDNYTDACPLEYYHKDIKITSLMDDNERAKFEYLLNYLNIHGEQAFLNRVKLLYKRKYILDNQSEV